MFTNDGKVIEIDRSKLIGSGCYGNVFINGDVCYKIFKTKKEFCKDFAAVLYVDNWDDTVINLLRERKYPNMSNIYNTLYELPECFSKFDPKELLEKGYLTSDFYKGYSAEYLKKCDINPLYNKDYFIKMYLELLELARKLAYDKICLGDSKFDNSILTEDGVKLIDFDMYSLYKGLGTPLRNNLDEIYKYFATLILYFVAKEHKDDYHKYHDKVFAPAYMFLQTHYYDFLDIVLEYEKPMDLVKKEIII